MLARTSSQGGLNPSSSLRSIYLLFPYLSYHTSQTKKQVSLTPWSASQSPCRAQASHLSTSRCRNPRGFILSKTKLRHVMLKTAQAILIFLSFSTSYAYSLLPPIVFLTNPSHRPIRTASPPPPYPYRKIRQLLSPCPPSFLALLRGHPLLLLLKPAPVPPMPPLAPEVSWAQVIKR